MIRLLLALTVAAVAAAAGSAAGWLFAADLPTDRQARALVAAAVPDQQAAIVNRFDVSFGYENGRYTPGFVTVTINYPDSAADSDLAIRVEQGFERMGWAVSNAGDGSGFEEAVGDGLSMRLINAAYCEPREPQWCGSEIGGSGPFPALALRFQPAAPWPVVPLSVAAWFAGLVAGWRLGGRSRLRWLGRSGLVLMLPAMVAVTAGTVRPGNEPAWASLMDRRFGALALAGAILLVVALIAGRANSDAPAAGGSAGASRSSAGQAVIRGLTVTFGPYRGGPIADTVRDGDRVVAVRRW